MTAINSAPAGVSIDAAIVGSVLWPSRASALGCERAELALHGASLMTEGDSAAWLRYLSDSLRALSVGGGLRP